MEPSRKGNHMKFQNKIDFQAHYLPRAYIAADVSDDGTVTGIANAPRHKPMEIKGQLMRTAAYAEI